jgi:hypothetical protein
VLGHRRPPVGDVLVGDVETSHPAASPPGPCRRRRGRRTVRARFAAAGRCSGRNGPTPRRRGTRRAQPHRSAHAGPVPGPPVPNLTPSTVASSTAHAGRTWAATTPLQPLLDGTAPDSRRRLSATFRSDVAQGLGLRPSRRHRSITNCCIMALMHHLATRDLVALVQRPPRPLPARGPQGLRPRGTRAACSRRDLRNASSLVVASCQSSAPRRYPIHPRWLPLRSRGRATNPRNWLSRSVARDS